jgi:hypothetical protein
MPRGWLARRRMVGYRLLVSRQCFTDDGAGKGNTNEMRRFDRDDACNRSILLPLLRCICVMTFGKHRVIKSYLIVTLNSQPESAAAVYPIISRNHINQTRVISALDQVTSRRDV